MEQGVLSEGARILRAGQITLFGHSWERAQVRRLSLNSVEFYSISIKSPLSTTDCKQGAKSLRIRTTV